MAQIFRDKALDQVARPDRLDAYIKVSNPSVLLLLGAIVAFLAGVGAWCVLGNVRDVQPGLLEVQDGTAVCYVDQSAASKLSAGDAVDVSGVTGTVVEVAAEALPASELGVQELEELAPKSQWLACAKVSIDLPQGSYPASVTVEELRPLDLLIGGK